MEPPGAFFLLIPAAQSFTHFSCIALSTIQTSTSPWMHNSHRASPLYSIVSGAETFFPFPLSFVEDDEGGPIRRKDPTSSPPSSTSSSSSSSPSLLPSSRGLRMVPPTRELAEPTGRKTTSKLTRSRFRRGTTRFPQNDRTRTVVHRLRLPPFPLHTLGLLLRDASFLLLLLLFLPLLLFQPRSLQPSQLPQLSFHPSILLRSQTGTFFLPCTTFPFHLDASGSKVDGDRHGSDR